MRKKHGLRKLFLLILTVIVIAVPLYIHISGYIKNLPRLQYTMNPQPLENPAAYPDARFAVISDLHYYDNSLGTSGKAFEAALQSDRKLLRDSAALLHLAIDQIKKAGVQFVLIPGDLTKDGELTNHRQVSCALSTLNDQGIKVFVIPGNHDINNPGAHRYEGDKAYSIPSVTAEQFAEIYADCGYRSALERDSHSLSYVAEPVEGLWLVALDTCRYRENKPGYEEIVSGKMSQGQEKWLEEVLEKAQKSNKAVMVMEHHGIVEHWDGQRKLHPNYLVQDHPYVKQLLASYGVRLAFTGHYHAQDVALVNFGSKGFIYDIESGSLVTPPSPMRICTLKDNKLEAASSHLIRLFYTKAEDMDKANQFVRNNIEIEAFDTLRKYFVPEKDARTLAGHVATSFVAHYNGDEKTDSKPAFRTDGLSLWSRFVFWQQKYVIDGLWKDLAPDDNNLVIDLSRP